MIANYEKYSSFLQEFHVLSSDSYNPVKEWHDLGHYFAEPKLGEQTFNLTKSHCGRYLKFRFLTHFGNEFYCTLSQIRSFDALSYVYVLLLFLSKLAI